MIHFENVSFSYKDSPVIKDFSLELAKGSRICFFGPSGCGKTTLLRLILGLEKPQKGQIVKSSDKISVVFQDNRLIPTSTVFENVSLVASKKEAHSVLNQVGLSDNENRLPSELSGGMKRKLSIARALAYNGDILLLDEPFNGIDLKNKKKIADIILKQFENKTIILISHLLEDAKLLNAKIIKM